MSIHVSTPAVRHLGVWGLSLALAALTVGCDDDSDSAGAGDSGAAGSGGAIGGAADNAGGGGGGYYGGSPQGGSPAYDEYGAGGGGGQGPLGGEPAGGSPAAPEQGAPPPDGVEEPETPEPGEFEENDFVDATEDAMSTFSVDVDTASYTSTRLTLRNGALPSPQAVRTEEFINFFRYDYPAPTPADEHPFTVHMEAGPSPFGEGLHMLKVGLQGMEIPAEERDPANLVFLVDVSGSMSAPNKLGLVRHSLKLLTNSLQPTDTLAIVTYAGHETTVLEPTPVAHRGAIFEAIDALQSGGGTNGAGGLRRAYELAQRAFRDDGVNRVVLCTDGDFNIGSTGGRLIDEVVSWRDRGIYMSVLGYGYQFNDSFLEALTNQAEGNYAFVDNRNEALRVLGTNLVGTLQVIAKDVKIQVEFNPTRVRRFRLVGYENRVLDHQDFRDDTVDAGEIGAGHRVTALYEVELIEGEEAPMGSIAPDETLAEVRFRYKTPTGAPDRESTELSTPFLAEEVHPTFEETSADFKFVTALVEFAEILRQSIHSEGDRFDEVHDIIEATHNGEVDRQELIELVLRAQGLFE